jgi:hypothetical protein
MISSGIKSGACDYLKWKHIIPIKDEVLAAKIMWMLVKMVNIIHS